MVLTSLGDVSAGAGFDPYGAARFLTDMQRDFADDDATVVVGTVIDPELEDELRVTVVATGLGSRRAGMVGDARPRARQVSWRCSRFACGERRCANPLG